jgi:hypothetical protein
MIKLIKIKINNTHHFLNIKYCVSKNIIENVKKINTDPDTNFRLLRKSIK